MRKRDPYPHWAVNDEEIPDPTGAGQEIVDALNKLRHVKGDAKLPRVWARIIKKIYGNTDANGKLLTRKVFILAGKGFRKSTIGASLALAHCCLPKLRAKGGSVILGASTEDQASIAFEEVMNFVSATPALRKSTRSVVSQYLLEDLKSGSTLQAVPAEGDSLMGVSPNFSLCDELGVWKHRKLWRALELALPKVPGAMLVSITNAGAGQEGVGYEEYQLAKAVATGEIFMPHYLPVLFEPEPGADWRTEATWYKANPMLGPEAEGGFPTLEGMRVLAAEAETKPMARSDFRRFNCSIWLDASESPFVGMDIYDACLGTVDLDDLRDRKVPCWLGVDLSQSGWGDLTVISAAFKESDGRILVHSWIFVAEDVIGKRTEQEHLPYREWHEAGLFIGIPGNVIELAAVQAKIEEICETFNVQEVAVDPYKAQHMNANLNGKGYPVIEHRQGTLSMGPAIDELERAILSKRFVHDGNAVQRWCFANVFVVRDKANNRSFHKQKSEGSKGKIDAAVACAMAVGRAALGETTKSIYADDKFDVTSLFV